MNTKGVFSHKTDEWATPRDLFYKLHNQFHFTLDPCSTDDNALCFKHYTQNENGLLQSWDGERVFCNPPYSNVRKWIEKAYASRALTVFLLPARTDTKWFHDLILNGCCQFSFIRGRLKFGDSKSGAPFPSMLVIIDNLEGYDE